MLIAWRRAIRPDLPIVCVLIFLNALKRTQTCNHVLFRSMHSTVGSPTRGPDPGTGIARVCSFAFFFLPFISARVPCDLWKTSCLTVFLFPSNGFCWDLGNTQPVCYQGALWRSTWGYDLHLSWNLILSVKNEDRTTQRFGLLRIAAFP